MTMEGKFSLPVVGVVVGLAILLIAEEFHLGDALVYGGGVIVLIAVGAMTLAIARIEPDEDGGGH